MSRDEGMTDACGEVEKLVGACSHKGTDGVCEACVLDALRRARAEALEEAARLVWNHPASNEYGSPCEACRAVEVSHSSNSPDCGVYRYPKVKPCTCGADEQNGILRAALAFASAPSGETPK